MTETKKENFREVAFPPLEIPFYNGTVLNLDPYRFETRYLPSLVDAGVVRSQMEELPGHISYWTAIEAYVLDILNQLKGEFYRIKKKYHQDEEGKWQNLPLIRP